MTCNINFSGNFSNLHYTGLESVIIHFIVPFVAPGKDLWDFFPYLKLCIYFVKFRQARK